MSQPLIVQPPIRIKDFDPDYSGGISKDEALERTEKLCQRLRELQELLYAEGHRAVLLVFQGMDASGKDGAARRLLRYVDPAGCEVTSFKVPTPEEDAHDFLWRIHKAVPRHGKIGVFNRSHYEEVLIDRALGWVERKTWEERYGMINDFERLLQRSGTVVLKFFLHISKEEQAARLQRRLKDPARRWKFDPSDLQMRQHWKDFMSAYEGALNACSPEDCRWHIIPGNRKWYRDYTVTRCVVEAMEAMHLKWPEPKVDLSKYKID